MRKICQKTMMALCLWFGFAVSAADAQVLVEQGKIKVSLEPGQKVADTLTIHNTGSDAADLNLYFEDFRYVEPFLGKKDFFSAGTVDHSCSPWINFYPQTVHLPPFAQKKINFTINTPSDASGGYYCVLFMEKTIVDGSAGAGGEGSKAGLTILSRVGTLFFVETNARIKKVSVGGVKADGKTISGTLTNQGDVTLVITPLFYIINSSSGVPVDRGELEKLYVPAGSTAGFALKSSSEISDGQYLAVLTFDLEDGVSAVSEIEFQKKGPLYTVISAK